MCERSLSMQPTREFLLYIVERSRGLLGRKLPNSTNVLKSIDIKASKAGEILVITFLYEGNSKETFLKADFERVSGVLSLYTLYYEVDLLQSLESRLDLVLGMRNQLVIAYSKLEENEIFLIARTRLPLKTFKNLQECVFYLAEIDVVEEFSRIQKKIFEIKNVQKVPPDTSTLLDVETILLRDAASRSRPQAPRRTSPLQSISIEAESRNATSSTDALIENSPALGDHARLLPRLKI